MTAKIVNESPMFGSIKAPCGPPHSDLRGRICCTEYYTPAQRTTDSNQQHIYILRSIPCRGREETLGSLFCRPPLLLSLALRNKDYLELALAVIHKNRVSSSLSSRTSCLQRFVVSSCSTMILEATPEIRWCICQPRYFSDTSKHI